MPLILKLKARAIRYLGILFVLVATAVSLKRTAFIAVSFGLITYAIIKHFLNIRAKRNSIISVIIIIAISAIAIYSYDVVSEKYHFDLQQRFQSLLIDGGSGRDAIYKGVIDLQLKSSVFDWVFGHGQGAVASKSPDELTAHDDFLEVLYDYGIIGLLLYVGIYIQLVRQLMRMLSNTSDLAAPFAASIMMFIVISLFSHLLIYLTYFYLLCLFWGISIAEYEISQKQMAGLYEIGLKQEGL